MAVLCSLSGDIAHVDGGDRGDRVASLEGYPFWAATGTERHRTGTAETRVNRAGSPRGRGKSGLDLVGGWAAQSRASEEPREQERGSFSFAGLSSLRAAGIFIARDSVPLGRLAAPTLGRGAAGAWMLLPAKKSRLLSHLQRSQQPCVWLLIRVSGLPITVREKLAGSGKKPQWAGTANSRYQPRVEWETVGNARPGQTRGTLETRGA